VPRVRRAAVALSLVLLVAASWPAAVHADGDPASDVLITDDIFLPYEQPSAGQVAKLRRVVEAARAAGRPVRVAVIHSARDLGAVTNLYGHAEEYATLLSRELQNPVEVGAEGHREQLLVVMSAGYATKNAPPEADRHLRGVELPSDASPDELVGAAGWGVQEIARIGGKPIREEFEQPEGDGGGGGGGAVVTILVVVGLLVLVGVLVAVRMRSGGAAQSPGGNT
jgi:hypothetical protein